jgi:hypothetical protein
VKKKSKAATLADTATREGPQPSRVAAATTGRTKISVRFGAGIVWSMMTASPMAIATRNSDRA